VFSGAAFALMAWDQQAGTGDRLIGGLPFFLLWSLYLRLASFPVYPYFRAPSHMHVIRSMCFVCFFSWLVKFSYALNV